MTRVTSFLLTLFILLCLPRVATAAEVIHEVPIAELTGRTAGADGETVRFQGEAIGEALAAGDGMVWVNVGASEVALGVFVAREDAQRIEFWGDYGHTGDTIEVEGRFNIACDEHGGDMDVHATTFDIVFRGVEREHKTDPIRFIIGLGGIAVAVMLGRIVRRARDEQTTTW